MTAKKKAPTKKKGMPPGLAAFLAKKNGTDVPTPGDKGDVKKPAKKKPAPKKKK
jgi:hypothetical protein